MCLLWPVAVAVVFIAMEVQVVLDSVAILVFPATVVVVPLLVATAVPTTPLPLLLAMVALSDKVQAIQADIITDMVLLVAAAATMAAVIINRTATPIVQQ